MVSANIKPLKPCPMCSVKNVFAVTEKGRIQIDTNHMRFL